MWDFSPESTETSFHPDDDGFCTEEPPNTNRHGSLVCTKNVGEILDYGLGTILAFETEAPAVVCSLTRVTCKRNFVPSLLPRALLLLASWAFSFVGHAAVMISTDNEKGSPRSSTLAVETTLSRQKR